jgi:N-acetylglucosaminyldiphosphoundecaprenol N-acetyl-beta-D-mannosaminyltransferase
MAFNQFDTVLTAHPRARALHEEADVSESDSGLEHATSQSDLTRPVYCVLGVPIDAVSMTTVVRRIEAAVASRSALFISTPNFNFLVNSLSDPEFRESLLDSDLCPPDGASIVGIARLLGLPIAERVAGADLLDKLQTRGTGTRRLSIFLFGGARGIAAAAANTLNAKPDGLACVGSMYPGFCEVSEMSKDLIIDAVNSSGADCLAASLGAKKGQQWLHRNRLRLTIPVRVHLGAAINFQAGSVKRAPPIVCAWGLEWLWRIKEENYLWKRYRDDGFVLMRLLLTRVLPLTLITRWHRLRGNHLQDLLIRKSFDGQSITISLCGGASEKHIQKAAACFHEALTAKRNVIIDLLDTRLLDARFFGLLLMLRKELRSRGAKLIFKNISRPVARMFRLNELEFLLSTSG